MGFASFGFVWLVDGSLLRRFRLLRVNARLCTLYLTNHAVVTDGPRRRRESASLTRACKSAIPPYAIGGSGSATETARLLARVGRILDFDPRIVSTRHVWRVGALPEDSFQIHRDGLRE